MCVTVLYLYVFRYLVTKTKVRATKRLSLEIRDVLQGGLPAPTLHKQLEENYISADFKCMRGPDQGLNS